MGSNDVDRVDSDTAMPRARFSRSLNLSLTVEAELATPMSLPRQGAC